MRLVAWNVAHAARECALRPGLLEAIASLKPDVLTLNEYVHGASRADFVAGLAELGLRHLLVSDPIPGHNQVLVASRQPITRGELTCPPVPDHHAASNFLHFIVGDLEVVALRAPAYERRSDLRAYWEGLYATVDSVRDRRIVFVGDLNADPDRNSHLGASYLRRLEAAGWRVPRPTGDWSCWTKADRRSRIDHLLASCSVPALDASYAHHVLVGNVTGAVSDHAALVVEVTRSRSVRGA